MTMPHGVRRWEDAAWPDLGDFAADGRHEVGLVPVGATEQHGPHLPTATDTIIATGICERASAQTGAPVLPAISIGCSYGHGTILPGTLSLTPDMLSGLVRQYAQWAGASGLTRLLFVNAHFGNAAALQVGTDHLRLLRPDLRSAVLNWWTLDPEVARESVLDGEDLHANRSETSVMLVLAPDLVHCDRLVAADDPDRTADLVFRYTAPSLSRNGVTGRPSEASVELGERLIDLTVTALVDRIERGRTEEPPLLPPALPDLAVARTASHPTSAR